jgi:hypothetical protein
MTRIRVFRLGGQLWRAVRAGNRTTVDRYDPLPGTAPLPSRWPVRQDGRLTVSYEPRRER